MTLQALLALAMPELRRHTYSFEVESKLVPKTISTEPRSKALSQFHCIWLAEFLSS